MVSEVASCPNSQISDQPENVPRSAWQPRGSWVQVPSPQTDQTIASTQTARQGAYLTEPPQTEVEWVQLVRRGSRFSDITLQ